MTLNEVYDRLSTILRTHTGELGPDDPECRAIRVALLLDDLAGEIAAAIDAPSRA